MEKSIKTKPQFYAFCLAELQRIAIDFGYMLAVHGSMNRDMDLVAVPWVDNPKPHIELLQEFERYLTGAIHITENDYMFSRLPGGRSSYVINLNRGGKFNGYIDEKYYLDISITPLVKCTPNSEI